MEQFLQLDRRLFELVNSTWTSEFLDRIFPVFTDLHKEPAAVVIAVGLLALWLVRSRMKALKVLLMVMLTIGLTDAVTYYAVKPIFQRARPAEPEVRLVLKSPSHSGFSFPSNHAANTFAVATVLTGFYPMGAPAFYSLAGLVAYSRVYVGVHYPFDVIGGALLGFLVGWILRRALKVAKVHFAGKAQVRRRNS